MRGNAHWNPARSVNPRAPTCVTCQGSHEVKSQRNVRSLTYVANVPALCSSCHSAALDSYRSGVQGSALFRERNFRAATCSSRHAAHAVSNRGMGLEIDEVSSLFQAMEVGHHIVKPAARYRLNRLHLAVTIGDDLLKVAVTPGQHFG